MAIHTPRLRQQLSYRRRLQLCEKGTTVDTPEMREVSIKVQLFRDNGITTGLLQVETGRTDEVAGSEEIRQFRPNVPIGLCQNALKPLARAEIDGLALAHIGIDLRLNRAQTLVKAHFDYVAV
jgi:hypothetical protein